MKYSDFEKNLSKKLSDHQLALDTDILMRQISQKTQSKRNPILWIMLGIVGLIASGLLTYYLFDHTEGTQAHNVPSAAIKFDASDETKSLNATEPKSDFEACVTTANSASLTNTSAHISETNIDVNTTSNISHDLPANNNFKTTNSDIEVSTKHQESTVWQEVDLSASSSNLQPALAVSQAPDNLQAKTSTKLITFASIPAINTMLIAPHIKNRLNKVECPTFSNNNKLNIELIADLGVLLPLKTLEMPLSEPDIITNLRKENENSRMGLHGDLLVKISHPSLPFFVQSGLQVDHLVERTDLTFNTIKRDTTIGIISVTTSPTGDTITYIYGDIVNTTEISGRKRRHYRLQTFDIPLHIGYEKQIGKWSYGVEGGPTFNIFTRSYGNILQSESDFIAIEETKPFKSNIGLSWAANLRVGYQLARQHKIYASTGMRLLNKNIANSTAFTQRYKLPGIQLGYGYSF